MDKIKFAIIGTGAILRQHIIAINNLKYSELVAVYSRDIKRARELGKKYNVKYYDDYEELLKEKEIDVVDIITIPSLHAEMGLKALGAGKHLLIEKPIDISIEKAMHLVNECKKLNLMLSVISQYRYRFSINSLYSYITNQRLGDILYGNIDVNLSTSELYYKNTPWREDKLLSGGGVLITNAIHYIDIIQWLLGDIKSVFGKIYTLKHDINVEDTALAILNFKNNASVTLTVSNILNKSNPDRIVIHGTKDSVICEGDDIVLMSENTTFFKRYKNKVYSKISKIIYYGNFKNLHEMQIKNFIDSIYGHDNLLIPGEDGVKSLKIVHAIYESAKSERMIHIPEPGGDQICD